MKKYLSKSVLNIIIFLTIAGFSSCLNKKAAVAVPNEYIPENILNAKAEVPSNPATDFVKNLGIAINIGNTLDAIGTFTWHAGETGWGNPPIEPELIKALKDFGYKTIRLPVTWAEYMGPAPDYEIEDERMDRVYEVVNWILAEDMFVIVNLHHDGGHSDKSWILDAANDPERVTDQFSKVWKQIASRFANVSQQKLIFESMNEVGFDKKSKLEAYNIFNGLNQAFVDTVRATPGNENRFLLIAGYWTDIGQTSDRRFKMPEDTIEHRLILSVHYYTPSTFCIAEARDNSWGFRETWGTPADYLALIGDFDKLKINFLSKGIPVILGEYGVTFKNKDEESRIKWMSAVTQMCINYGICPALWDTGGEINRHDFTMEHTLEAVWDSIIIR